MSPRARSIASPDLPQTDLPQQTRAEWVTPLARLLLSALLPASCACASTTLWSEGSRLSPSASSTETVFVEPHAYERFLAGELARIAGDFSSASQAYEEALQGSVEDPFLLARWIEVRYRSGDTDSTEQALETYLARYPESEALWLARGRIAEGQGNRSRAQNSFLRAACVEPHSPLPVLALASLLEAQAPQAAIAALRAFRERSGGTPDTLARELHIRLAASPDDAHIVPLTMRLLQLVAPSSGAAVTALEALLAKGRSEVAARLLRELSPSQVPLSLRVQVFLEAGDLPAAESALAGQGSISTEARVQLWLALKQHERAHTAAERAWLLDPSPANRFLVALAGSASGQRGQRVRAAQGLAQSMPATSSYLQARARLAETLARENLAGLAELIETTAQR